MPEEDIASATGVTNTARTMGGCIAVSICTALLHNSMDTGLAHILSRAQLSAIKESLATMNDLDGEIMSGVMRVFGDAYNRQFRVLITFALCNVLVAGLLVLAGEVIQGDEGRRTDEDSSRGDAHSEVELGDSKQQSEQKSIEA